MRVEVEVGVGVGVEIGVAIGVGSIAIPAKASSTYMRRGRDTAQGMVMGRVSMGSTGCVKSWRGF